MSLYGYYLPNTPKLEELQEKGEIAVYTDVVSPHSNTIPVLQKLFTFSHNESDKPWYKYNNLIDIMNAAGYKTYWLSNQESSGIWGNVAQYYGERSSVHRYTRLRESREDEGILDEELFPLIDDAIADMGDGKSFIVAHLMGGMVCITTGTLIRIINLPLQILRSTLMKQTSSLWPSMIMLCTITTSSSRK